MTLRIKNIRMQIVLGMMSLIALIIAASLLGFAFFSRHKLRQMVLERAINQSSYRYRALCRIHSSKCPRLY